MSDDYTSHRDDPKIFEHFFSKYLPVQSYDYYYNRLFNALTLDSDADELADEYFYTVQNYLHNKNYAAAFQILRSYVEAMGDTGHLKLHDQEFLEQEMVFERLLRIVAQKSPDGERQALHDWFASLEQRNYFGNIYLESTVDLIRKLDL